METGRLKVALIAVWLTALASPAIASGAMRFAEPGGDGAPPCADQLDPCDLLTAVQGAGANDDVLLASGSYSVSEVVDIPDNVNVGGVPGEELPVITGTAFYVFDMDGSGARLHDVEVRTNSLYGVFVAGTMDRAIVRATTNGTACVAAFGVMRDSVCTNTDASGIAVGIESVCGAPGAHQEARVVNVTAISAAGPGVAVSAEGGCDIGIDATNVIASGSPTDVTASADLAAGSRAEVEMTSSAFDSSAAPGANDFVTAPGTALNITDPGAFVDAPGGNYRQLPSSPTRNAGTSPPDLGQFDLDLEPRSAQGAADIGADEYFPPPPVKIKQPKAKRLTAVRAKKRVRFVFSANFATLYECKVDKDAWFECRSPDKFPLSASRGDGTKHVVKIRSVNAIGEKSKPARWRGRVVRKS